MAFVNYRKIYDATIKLVCKIMFSPTVSGSIKLAAMCGENEMRIVLMDVIFLHTGHWLHTEQKKATQHFKTISLSKTLVEFCNEKFLIVLCFLLDNVRHLTSN